MVVSLENEGFKGKVAFVTGAASGIGRATAIAFARAGADVVVADLAEHDNADTARAVESLGVRSLAVRCDVTISDDVEAAMQSTLEAFGRLDAAFNNAGIEQCENEALPRQAFPWEVEAETAARSCWVCRRRGDRRGRRFRSLVLHEGLGE